MVTIADPPSTYNVEKGYLVLIEIQKFIQPKSEKATVKNICFFDNVRKRT